MTKVFKPITKLVTGALQAIGVVDKPSPQPAPAAIQPLPPAPVPEAAPPPPPPPPMTAPVAPTAPPPPPAPTPEQPAVEAEIKKAVSEERRPKSRDATILTPGGYKGVQDATGAPTEEDLAAQKKRRSVLGRL